MDSLAQMVAQGYRIGAPTFEVEEMDAQAIAGMKCPKCGGLVHYEGYHRHTRGCTEYVALAVCNKCGHQRAF